MTSTTKFCRRALGGFALLLACGALHPNTAHAATFTVSNLNDAGAGSLRQAIIDANAVAGADTIVLPSNGHIELKSALPDLSNLTIKGPAMDAVSVIGPASSGSKFRIFTIPVGVSVTLLNFTLGGGNVAGFGGGVNNSGTLAVTNLKFLGNKAGQDGGAISNFHGTLRVNNCLFINNEAGGSGGAIASDARQVDSGSALGPATLSVARSFVSGNAASGNGGGIANFEGALTIATSTLTGNNSTQLGGGLYTEGNTTLIETSTFDTNRADEGGGFYSAAGTTVRNCTITENFVTRRGGGFSNTDRLTTVENCTIARNRATQGQGAGAASVGDDGQTSTRFSNSIVTSNLPLAGTGGTDLDFSGNKNSFVSNGYNLVGTGSGVVAFTLPTDRTGITNAGLGVLGFNGGPTKTIALLADSPAINTGNTALTIDQRGVARPQGTRDDVGAWEFNRFASSLVVTTLADEDNSTSDARYGTGTSLREAIDFANSNPNSSTITFNLAGTGAKVIELSRELPLLTTAITINGPGASRLTIKRGGAEEYSLLTVNFAGAINISGLTFSDGIASLAGGAIANEISALTLSQCVFTGNRAAIGGALANFGGPLEDGASSSISVFGCSFVSNTNDFDDDFDGGGAIFNTGGVARVDNSTFFENDSLGDGGAILNSGIMIVNRCTLAGNQSDNMGGAITNYGSMKITNSTLTGNSAYEGGAIYHDAEMDDSLALQNCTLSGNTSNYYGGALSNDRGLARLDSCTITANTAPGGRGGGVYSLSSSAARTEVRNSIIAGNVGTDVDFGGGATNTFVSKGYNVVGDGNAMNTFAQVGDQRDISGTALKLGALANNGGPTRTHALLAGSPALNRGNTNLTTDQRGIVRPQGSADDVGAFEADVSNAAPTLVRLTAPNGFSANVSGNPPTVSPLLNGQSPLNTFVTFTSVVRDPNGNADLSNVSFILGGGASELRLTYNAASNLLNASSPTGTSGNFAPGSANVLTVSTGALDCAGTSVTRSGTDLTIVWRLKVTSAATVNQRLRLHTRDKGNLTSPALVFGNWTFTAPSGAAEAASSGSVSSSPSGASF